MPLRAQLPQVCASANFALSLVVNDYQASAGVPVLDRDPKDGPGMASGDLSGLVLINALASANAVAASFQP
jgi:hypothetical protein